MILLAGLLDVLFRALAFVGLALGVGGVVFEHAVLRPAARATGENVLPDSALRRAASVTAAGAFLVAGSQFLALAIVPWALADDAGGWPIEAFLSTGFARAAIMHVALALAFGVVAMHVRCRPRSHGGRVIEAALAALCLASGGPLTHGASRLANPAVLMTVTVLHQLPSAVWIGGAAHLVAQWRLLRGQPEAREYLWPWMLARFSPLAIVCVSGLLIAGLYLARQYIDGSAGLVGTAYGTMLLTKVGLMSVALCLGGVSFLAIHDWKTTGRLSAVLSRVPVLVEAEAAIGVCILMTAAAFTGQPPAVDVLPGRATPAEVARVFAPKTPQFTMPPFAEMVATSSLALDPYSPPGVLEKVQSNFNHNVSGAFVLLAGLGALLHRAGGVRWARHWPLAFVPLGVFVLVIAEPTVWPLGPEGFWATLVAPEVLVHRVAALLVIGLGLFEWRVRAGGLGGTRGRYVFPLLCLVGGALLLTHSHSAFATRWAFLVEVSHNALATFAVLAGAARWLDLRLPGREGRLAGVVWPVCLALVGAVLLFYRET